jgi:hypothetical protein
VYQGNLVYFHFASVSSFFGNFGFHFGGGDSGHKEIPRGGTITMDFDVALEDLYIGRFIEVDFEFLQYTEW